MKNSPLRRMTAHNNLHGLLFQATSAEYIALCTQMYQLARHALNDRLRLDTFRQPAVIFDLDETLLDNSAYAAWQIKAGTNFNEVTSWTEWCDTGQSGAVPGGVEFVKFAKETGATPIFITTRLNETRRGTARNLMKLGVLSEEELEKEEMNGTKPEHAFDTQLFMKGMPDVQVERPNGKQTFQLANKFMQRVFCGEARGFEIILSLGDNLSDYAEYYGRVFDPSGAAEPKAFPTVASRRNSVLQDLNLFGRDFILLPNATYGGWLSAFEANGLGASDELASTGDPVREGLEEPQGRFHYGVGQVAESKGPKLSPNALRIWSGPGGSSKSDKRAVLGKNPQKPKKEGDE